MAFFNQMSFINSRWAYSHVTLKAIEHTQQFGLSMITLFLIRHTLSSPYIHLRLQAFQNNIRKTKGWGYGKKNHIEPNKIILTKWVNKALNQSLTKHNNIKSRLKVMVIWPFTCLKAMDNICLDP